MRALIPKNIYILLIKTLSKYMKSLTKPYKLIRPNTLKYRKFGFGKKKKPGIKSTQLSTKNSLKPVSILSLRVRKQINPNYQIMPNNLIVRRILRTDSKIVLPCLELPQQRRSSSTCVASTPIIHDPTDVSSCAQVASDALYTKKVFFLNGKENNKRKHHFFLSSY